MNGKSINNQWLISVTGAKGIYSSCAHMFSLLPRPPHIWAGLGTRLLLVSCTYIYRASLIPRPLAPMFSMLQCHALKKSGRLETRLLQGHEDESKQEQYMWSACDVFIVPYTSQAHSQVSRMKNATWTSGQGYPLPNHYYGKLNYAAHVLL